MSSYGLIVDVSRCTGCYACVVACKSENRTRPGVSWIRIDVKEDGEFPNVSRTYTPVLCRQCEQIPCAAVCPYNAITRDKKGIVHFDKDLCRCGQSLCVEACPYGAISINQGRRHYFEEEEKCPGKAAHQVHEDGVAEKCTLCSHRLEKGESPFCVQTCPTQALRWGELQIGSCVFWE